MRALWRVILGPVLLWQGAGVRRRILRMPEPEGPRKGGTGGLRVLILGDSSAAGVGVAIQDHAISGRLAEAYGSGLAWEVLARTGWTTADALEALEDHRPARYDTAIICLGVNDITTETGIARWLETYSRVLERLEARGAKRAYLFGMPPMGRFPALPQPLRWYMGIQSDAHDRALITFADQNVIAVHVPVATDLPDSAAADDGFHPGPLVYDRMGKDLATRLRADETSGLFAC